MIGACSTQDLFESGITPVSDKNIAVIFITTPIFTHVFQSPCLSLSKKKSPSFLLHSSHIVVGFIYLFFPFNFTLPPLSLWEAEKFSKKIKPNQSNTWQNKADPKVASFFHFLSSFFFFHCLHRNNKNPSFLLCKAQLFGYPFDIMIHFYQPHLQDDIFVRN